MASSEERPDSGSGAAAAAAGDADALAVPPLTLINARGEVSQRLANWIDEYVQPLSAVAEGASATTGGSFLGQREMAVVAALGVRGCGKSTLLNELFGSRFAVGRAYGRRARGTRGCTISVAAVPPAPWLLLMDSEGVDGREVEEAEEMEEAEAEALIAEADSRAASRRSTGAADATAAGRGGGAVLAAAGGGGVDGGGHAGHRARPPSMRRAEKVAMLAATIADVLVINVWYADLGRAEAAGYVPLVRTIFSEHLKLFTKESPARSKLLFVVHDHDDGSPLASVAKVIERDVLAIWANQVEKPAEYSGTRVRDHFDVEVLSLPHPRYRAEQYAAALNALRDRILQGRGAETGVAIASEGAVAFTRAPANLLAPAVSKELPVEGFATYVEMVWRELVEANDIDTPGYSELLAVYRCDRVAERLHALAHEQIAKWYAEVDSGKVVENFGRKAQELLNSTGEQYDADTSAYATTDGALIRSRKRHELMSTLQNHLRALFNRQVQILQNQALNKFRDQMLSLIADRSGMVSEFESQFLVRRVDEFFFKRAEELLVPSMRLTYRASRTDLQNTLLEAASRYRDSPTSQLQAMTRMEKRAMAPMPKQRGVVVGFGLNTALRPRGYGNFQLIASTSRGPHTFNATMCNDADLAEQEGHGKVPLFRWQPTIHFDVDL
ncbi:hypothetical protein CDCA_CDCA03G1113 [Cyanidium caldarium]|uniref:Sey1/RHD3-like three-helix bundle domain-containing protein n=1 Tax=Cyanidium caldarium TaxID=2771 RepID=A0AAV9ISN2_CYACA|nr:hypothetical protein CDCA_CDCA03G1113 [Cyanidium caldarium]